MEFRGRVVGFHVEMSGLAQVLIEMEGYSQPQVVLVESGHGLRMFASVFGSLQAAVGREIEFDVDEFGVMKQFALPEEAA